MTHHGFQHPAYGIDPDIRSGVAGVIDPQFIAAFACGIIEFQFLLVGSLEPVIGFRMERNLDLACGVESAQFPE
jgi:hypothetical protein